MNERHIEMIADVFAGVVGIALIVAICHDENEKIVAIEKTNIKTETSTCYQMPEWNAVQIDAPMMEYIGEFDCAAYCCEQYPHICGGTGITASGTIPTPGVTAGANFDILPPGTWIYIKGVGVLQIQDTGKNCPTNHIDVAVDTHKNALAWAGYGIHDVYVLEWGEIK